MEASAYGDHVLVVAEIRESHPVRTSGQRTQKTVDLLVGDNVCPTGLMCLDHFQMTLKSRVMRPWLSVVTLWGRNVEKNNRRIDTVRHGVDTKHNANQTYMYRTLKFRTHHT